MTNSFIQVPPDSTGKKLHALEHVVGGNTVQIQAMHLADPVEPLNTQRIDFRGAASVRFSEGSPLSDGFGSIKVSENTTVGLYDFVVDDAADLFSDVVVGGGTVSYLAAANTMSLAVDSANGSFASRTSDKYHYYIPGTSNLVMMTVALSDSSHAGTERRWGAFDTNDGLYFDLDDTGALKVSVRNSTSGAVVTTQVSRTNWNGDKLDGTGLSGFTLDLTKINVYWLDYQWLGAGRVRFGVIDSYGNRIVAHTILNANTNIYPYMRSGSLPIQINIENKAITSGAASIRLTCASVQTEGKIDYTFWRYSYNFPQKTATSNTLLGSIKCLNTVDAAHNNVNAYPDLFSCYVASGSIKLDIYWDYLTLNTPTWALDNGSTVLGDIAGTVTIAGTEYKPLSIYLDAGSHTIDLKPYFEVTDIGLTARADETTPQYISVVASSVSGTPTIQGTISYRELR